MANEAIIESVSLILKNKYKKFPSIISAYIYGSLLTTNFSKTSDIDILFILNNLDDPSKFLKEIKTIRSEVKDFKLDINVVFLDEFTRRWHIYRPPTYFYWIKSRNVLLWGKNLIKNVDESEITAESLFRRAVDLAQSSRSVYLNGKDDSFWENKYKRWVSTLICEISYLDDELEFNFSLCAKRLVNKYPVLKNIKLLYKDKPTMEEISKVAEDLVCFLRKNFL